MSNDDLIARDLASFWHPASQMRHYREFPPVEVVGARGARLELAGGKILLDAISSWWCKSLGHGHPRLRAALTAQLDAFEHVIVAGTTNAALVRLCERLLALANGLPLAEWGPDAAPGRRPGHFGKVFLADNGSTGVEIALKMAIQAQAQRGQPQRTHFAALENGYHGETVGTLSLGDLGLYGGPFRALTFPVAKLGGLPYRRGPEDPRWMDAGDEWPVIQSQLDALAPSLCAIVYEPVLQAAGGMRLYSPDLLRRLHAWTRDHGVYLIADEIAAGMGRLGTLLASHLCPGVMPDFAVLSKGLTGGFLPLSAVLTSDEIYQLFDSDELERAFLHSNTYTGNALGVAVALASLDAYAVEDVLGAVRERGGVLRAEMATLVRDRPWLRGLRSAGLVAAVDLTSPDGRPLERRMRTGTRVYREAIGRGALLRPLGDTMYLFPPLNTPLEDLREMVRVLGHSVDSVLTSEIPPNEGTSRRSA
jgi:adenosylmethionine-8-amino-7-oxononanoate aminotransferase